MIKEFKDWLKRNITKDCNSNIAYEQCKRHIFELNPTADEYQELIEIAVDWIDF
jgi:hypothetical protein